MSRRLYLLDVRPGRRSDGFPSPPVRAEGDDAICQDIVKHPIGKAQYGRDGMVGKPGGVPGGGSKISDAVADHDGWEQTGLIVVEGPHA